MDWNDRELLANAAGMALSYAGSVDDRPTTPSQAALDALAAFDEPLTESAATRRRRCGCSPTSAAPPPSRRRAGATSASSRAPRTRSRSAARGWRPRGTRTPRCPSCRRWRPGCTTSCARGWSTCCVCPRKPGWRSSPARPSPTPPASPPPATSCSPGRLGRRRPTGCSARRRSRWCRRARRIRRCRSRSGCRAGRTRVRACPPTTRGGCAPTLLPDLDGAGPGVRAGRGGQHRRLRPVRRDRRLARRAGRLAARRRRVRPVGARPTRRAPRSSPGSTGPTRGRPTGTSGSTSLRLRHRLRSPARRPPADVRRGGGLPAAGRAFEAMHHTPQSSQRARQVEVWAVLRTLGRRGVADWSRGRARRPRSPSAGATAD